MKAKRKRKNDKSVRKMKAEKKRELLRDNECNEQMWCDTNTHTHTHTREKNIINKNEK